MTANKKTGTHAGFFILSKNFIKNGDAGQQ